MVPTFLQKRRSAGPVLRLWLAIVVLSLSTIAYAILIATVIANQRLNAFDKFMLISLVLLIALLYLGVFDRLRR